MKPSAVTHLLREVAALGIELRLNGDAIRYWPREAMPEALAARLRAHREEVALVLQARRDPLVAAVLDTFNGDLVENPSPWSGIGAWREGTIGAETCRVCGSRSWWRRKGGGPQVCERCHPCPYGPEHVERWEVQP